MNKERLGFAVIIFLIAGFGAMTTVNMQPEVKTGTPQDQAVAVDKEQFIVATRGLCNSKLDQYKDQIMNPKTASAEELGKQIDQLREEEGCYSFASEVLNNLVQAEPAESKK